jgi:hypothetical protein
MEYMMKDNLPDEDVLALLTNLKERRRGGEVPDPDLWGIALDLAIKRLKSVPHSNGTTPEKVISMSQLMAELLCAGHLFDFDHKEEAYGVFVDSWNDLPDSTRSTLMSNIKKYLVEQLKDVATISD